MSSSTEHLSELVPATTGDTFIEHTAEVCEWLRARATTAQTAVDAHKKRCRELAKHLRQYYREFTSPERRALYEVVLGLWLRLLEHGELEDDEWKEERSPCTSTTTSTRSVTDCADVSWSAVVQNIGARGRQDGQGRQWGASPLSPSCPTHPARPSAC